MGRKEFPNGGDAVGDKPTTVHYMFLLEGKGHIHWGWEDHKGEKDCIVPHQKLLEGCLSSDSL